MILLKEVNLETGLLKMNRNLAALTTGSFVLIGIGMATGKIISTEPVVSYLSGGLLGVNALITGSWAYQSHKQLKKKK